MSKKTAFYSSHHHQLGKPGGPGLFHEKGNDLPNYITNVAKGIQESGQADKSKAIKIAIGKVRDWAEGKGNVSPEVRAASQKAIAEWDAKRAKARATPNKGRTTKTSHPREAAVELAHAPDPEAVARSRRTNGRFTGGPDRNTRAAEIVAALGLADDRAYDGMGEA